APGLVGLARRTALSCGRDGKHRCVRDDRSPCTQADRKTGGSKERPWNDSSLQLSTSITRGIAHRFVVSKTALSPRHPPRAWLRQGATPWDLGCSRCPLGDQAR